VEARRPAGRGRSAIVSSTSLSIRVTRPGEAHRAAGLLRGPAAVADREVRAKAVLAAPARAGRAPWADHNPRVQPPRPQPAERDQ